MLMRARRKGGGDEKLFLLRCFCWCLLASFDSFNGGRTDGAAGGQSSERGEVFSSCFFSADGLDFSHTTCETFDGTEC